VSREEGAILVTLDRAGICVEQRYRDAKTAAFHTRARLGDHIAAGDKILFIDMIFTVLDDVMLAFDVVTRRITGE
jgi:hypothetical protein